MKILFRADGNADMGLGHLYRLFALVEMYRKHYDYEYLSSERSAVSVIPADYTTTLIPQAVGIHQEAMWLKSNYDAAACILIADGYQFDATYQLQIKNAGFKLMYLDDLAEEFMHADIVVNHSPGINANLYKAQQYTQFALGLSYSILRPAFLKAAKKNRNITGIDTAFVCFGGADHLNLTHTVVSALNRIPRIRKIHIILGGAYKHEKIQEFIQNGAHICIHRNLNETALAEIMESCNLGIVPASTILYELCSVKMPIISGYYVDNQEHIYKGFSGLKAISGLGDLRHKSTNDFIAAVEALLGNPELWHSQVKQQGILFDSDIENRFLELIKKLC